MKEGGGGGSDKTREKKSGFRDDTLDTVYKKFLRGWHSGYRVVILLR
jgi:hypothetical protein